MRQPKQTERSFLIFYAKVLLRESAARRDDAAFGNALFEWSCKAYREAVATPRHQAFQRVSHQPKPRLDTLPLFASTSP